MQKWDYLKFEIRRGEVISINGQDPRSKETWGMLGYTFTTFKGEKVDDISFIKALGDDGWEIAAMSGTDLGTQIIIAKKPR